MVQPFKSESASSDSGSTIVVTVGFRENGAGMNPNVDLVFLMMTAAVGIIISGK